MSDIENNKEQLSNSSKIYALFYSFFLIPLMLTIFGVLFFFLFKLLTYEKQDPYTVVRQLSPDTIADQDFGYQVVARNDGRTIVVSAPTRGQGTVHFLFRAVSTAGTPFSTQSSVTMTENNDNTSMLGYTLSMSKKENFVSHILEDKEGDYALEIEIYESGEVELSVTAYHKLSVIEEMWPGQKT